ncbi:putative pentatricopeptide repeat-containing protein At3g11460, mitochondrial [Malania oleifera]|uniref:putative pentatricopeptide repeat-containing protein At3g11460, mitochondrial n=1 Tax=Malania oleifera TaxID=397392 RepID=UPI0025ADD58B|nr:putative pentatricopeptide repeat-containing protein At3g11460, mitochondrial [Malania oleifera]
MNGAVTLTHTVSTKIKTHLYSTTLLFQLFPFLIPLYSSYTTTTTQFAEQAPQHLLTSLQCGASLQAFTNTKSLRRGQQLHAHMTSCGVLHNNTYISTKLAAFYASCGRMADAQVIFDGTVLKNSFLWSFMIRGYACKCDGSSVKALVLYREMRSFGRKADNFAYPFVLKACGDLLLVEIGRRVHCEIVVCGFESDVYVGNSLMAMYSKFGDMGTVRDVFDRMPERDLTSWNTLISGYVKNGDPREALLVFHLMGTQGITADCTTLLGLLSASTNLMAVKQGKAIHCYAVRNGLAYCNIYLINSLIEIYCVCNSMMYARLIFEEVTWKDTVSWNSMISGYSRSGDAFESLRLFCQMVLNGKEPDQVTLIAVLGACDQIAALQFGMSVHSLLFKKGFDANAMVGTALINMYSKCGNLECSRHVFDEIPNKNLFSWSAMVAGYGSHGMGREAISIFHKMTENSIIPDEGVFTSILSACSHAGLVDEGKDIFYRMTKEYSVRHCLAHYSCMVDLLSRAGQLDEAYEFIKTMEVRPTGDIWAALLSACLLHRNVKLAEISAQKAFEMNPEKVGSYICLSNMYAAEKRWDDVERVRALVRRNRLKKPPGCSFIELDKVIHWFLVGDRSHQQAEDIYAKLEDLRKLLKEAGYKPDTSSVFYDAEDEVKEKMLWDHSERLAIAFALINTSPGTVIRIIKNLRTCGDCHIVTKLISKLMGREIIIRDIRRFHHFKNGLCSCGDYWLLYLWGCEVGFLRS